MRASFLKEFFEVQMVVQNLTTGFTFDNGSATLTLPPGLSLAPIADAQSLTQPVEDIPGGQSRMATWLVRGDTEGSYDLSAVYGGTVEPIGQGIQLTALTQSPLQVWGASALQTTITADCLAARWAPYHISIAVKNISDTDVYNFMLELLDRPATQPKEDAEYFFAPGTEQAQGAGVIKPGDTFLANFTVLAGIGSSQVQQMQLDLMKSFVAKTGGDVDLKPILACADGPTADPNPVTTTISQDSAGADYAHVTWDPPTGWVRATAASRQPGAGPSGPIVWKGTTTGVSTTVTNGATAVADSTTAIFAPPDTTLADMDPACRLEPGNVAAICSSGPMGPGESRTYSYSVVAPAGGVRITGYELYTRPSLGSGPWTGYPDAPALSGGAGPAAMGGVLDIPAADRAAGRYYGVRAIYADGSKVDSFVVGTGPARYAALGDSFSSGAGVPDFEPGTAADIGGAGDNRCHRSAAGSYSRLLVADPSVTADLEPATFGACSDAVTADVFSAGGGQGNQGEPAQIDRVDQFTDLITLTIGGNDVGLADIAANCALGDCVGGLSASDQVNPSLPRNWDQEAAKRAASQGGAQYLATLVAQGLPGQSGISAECQSNAIKTPEGTALCVAHYQGLASAASVDSLYNGVLADRLVEVYTRLAKKAPNAQIAVLPYAQYIGGFDPGQSDPAALCELGFPGLALSFADRFRINEFIDRLNGEIAKAVGRANAQLGAARVHMVRPAVVDAQFSNGQLCQDGPANPGSYVNPIVDGNGLVANALALVANSANPGYQGPGGASSYSLQLNALGQQAYERALAAALDWSSTTTTDQPPAASPVARVTSAASATDPRTATFDAAGSTRANGSLAYTWLFSDGTSATGATVT
ncbi:MAG: hypothetical protein LBQ06_00005, partial [Frankiaceae bacterium]|nr:hypothetical protein [Frankiaceae bacterium]